MEELLDFEAAGAGPGKARRIRERFGLSSARYHMALQRAIWEPAAIVYAPQLVLRLRRMSLRRRALRTAGRLGAASASGTGDARQGRLELEGDR